MVTTDPASREWDAATYHRVSGPQVRWGTALLDRVSLRGDERALDAGCGTGLLAAELLARLPRGGVVGLDRSTSMVARAREHIAGRAGGGRFLSVTGDLLALPLAPDTFDLVFSTATFHWVADHQALFDGVARVLRPGGRLVAQCGGAGNIARVHGWAEEAMSLSRLAPWFEGWVDPWEFATPEVTAERLARAGLRVDEVGLQPAPTVLAGEAEYADFVRAIVLRPFLARLPAEGLRERFVHYVVARAAVSDPPWSLDYVRLTMVATQPER